MDIQTESNNLDEGRKPGGQPGNQNARKKPFTEQMKRYIIQNPEKMEKIIEGVFKEAEEGSLAALQIIMDRVEGKPQQSTEVSVAEGSEVKGIMLGFVEGNANPT